MKSQEILDNTSKNELAKTNISKKKNIKILIIISCIIFISFSLIIVCKQVSIIKAQKEYTSMIDSYNVAVNEFNSETEKITNLYQYLKQVSSIKSNKNFQKKQIMEYDFETFKNNGYDINSIKEQTNQCITDKDNLCKQYNDICLNEYNSAITQYNDIVNQYNLIWEKAYEYGIDSLPPKEKEKNIKSDADEKWENLEKYKQSLSKINEEKNALYQDKFSLYTSSYNYIIDDYNTVVKEYNNLIKETSITFIQDMVKNPSALKKIDDVDTSIDNEKLINNIETIKEKTNLLINNYIIAMQITNPEEEWVIRRLNSVSEIIGIQAVSFKNDPNGLLGKDGGYNACVYFTVKKANPETVTGESTVDKGTDAGGAIEVYDSLEYALNRCDYLSQFDGTLLYSGSYTIVGTMVVRTSYRLTSQQQVDLTNSIINEFTKIK